jgi:hypothetical protein
MKRTIVSALVAASLLAAIANPVSATEVGYNRKFGLGVMVGDPTGLSAKLWVAPTNALDFGLGFWGYGVNNRCVNNDCTRYGYSNGTFHMDYLWQSNIVRGQAQLDWHIGVGGRTVWWGGCNNNCFELSARAPAAGLDLMFNNPAFIEIFFELALGLIILPGIYPQIEGGLGARFYF